MSLHQLDIRREHEDPVVADRPRITLGILEHPFELHVPYVGPPERHGQFGRWLIG